MGLKGHVLVFLDVPPMQSANLTPASAYAASTRQTPKRQY